jgi:hypothetical protein
LFTVQCARAIFAAANFFDVISNPHGCIVTKL